MADAGSDDEYIPQSSPPETKVSAPVLNVEHAEEKSYRSRPNRYFGPDSTWLSWTEHERLVAQSLDQSRSQNLGLHLLNAHALKRKAENEHPRARRSRKGKQRASSVASGRGGDQASLRLPQRWTAWPLPPEDVPRDADDVVGCFEGSRSTNESSYSASLENCLIGISTKIARARWRSREWESMESEDTPEPKATTDTKDVSVKVEGREATQELGPQDVQNPEISDAAETFNSESDTDSEDNPQAIQSQAYLAEEDAPKIQTKTTETVDEPESEENEDPPTPIADDEQARNLLLPSTRHILTKLDGLLTGLHKARRAYAPSKRRMRRDSQASETDADQMQTSRSRSRSRARRNRRSTSRTSETSNNSEYSNVSEASKQNLGLRDWSDVVGMAALTDWDPAVVQRASERCAKLFGENMIFRTFQQSIADSKERPSETEHYALKPVDIVPEEVAQMEGINDVRTTVPCEICRVNRRKCEPATAGVKKGVCKSCLENGNECTGIGTNPKSQPVQCPFRFCERHHIPFGKPWHLQRHIEAVHSEDRTPMPSSPARSSASEGHLSSTALPVCPVASCARHERPFSEGGKLYRHLRNMHPEVDVDGIKKLEVHRRGERRGRWRNESRRSEVGKKNRSRSAGVPSSPSPLIASLHDTDEEG